MAFKLVRYSQQDPQWKSDVLGFGNQSDKIGYVGCALTSVAMLLSGHGYAETPSTLNKKLKSVNGFAGAGIRWGGVTQIHPQVVLKAFIPCTNSAAPLAQIDAALDVGQPAVVMVDSAPASGVQTHWVVLYARKDGDYLMLDPWPYPSDSKDVLLTPRYSQGRSLQRSIMHVILYENSTADPVPLPEGEPAARVKTSVVWGLNIRSSPNTSSTANVIETVPAGTPLVIAEPGGGNKIGAVNQWVRVRTPSGREGVAAAWYLEKVSVPVPEPSPVEPEPEPSPVPPVTPPPASPAPVDPNERLKVLVPARVGSSGLPVYAFENTRARVVSVQSMGSVLACVEPYPEARAKVGVRGAWLKVRFEKARFGFVQADMVDVLR